MIFTEYLKEINEGKKLGVTSNLGYVITPNCIRRCLRVSQEEKMVLFEIYSLYNEEKKSAFPTQQTLAMYLGTTSSTISKILKKLEDKAFISSKGKQGKKKSYYPSFELENNPYLVLSELFHFATKTINKHVSDDVVGEWGNKIMGFVNVKHQEEFTEKDLYGSFIKRYKQMFYPDNFEEDFLKTLTAYFEEVTNSQISINWSVEMKEFKERKKEAPKRTSMFSKRKGAGASAIQGERNTDYDNWGEPSEYDDIFKRR